MNDQNDTFQPEYGMLEGTIEKAYITVKEIPTREVENQYGIEIHIGEEDINV